jgi:DNA-binding transcriptional MocR family regulator
VELPDGIDTTELYHLSACEGIYFRPGHMFSASRKFQSHLRLCAGTWNPAVQASVYRLGELACAMAKGTVSQLNAG